MKEYDDIDPFGEEDWEEVESHAVKDIIIIRNEKDAYEVCDMFFENNKKIEKKLFHFLEKYNQYCFTLRTGDLIAVFDGNLITTKPGYEIQLIDNNMIIDKDYIIYDSLEK